MPGCATPFISVALRQTDLFLQPYNDSLRDTFLPEPISGRAA
jgi:hypothetical protein